MQEGWRTLEALQDEGLVKAIGIYTSKPDMLRRLLDVCQVPFSAVHSVHCNGDLHWQVAAALSQPACHVMVWSAAGAAVLSASSCPCISDAVQCLHFTCPKTHVLPTTGLVCLSLGCSAHSCLQVQYYALALTTPPD